MKTMLDVEQIQADLLCNAFEGGSNYWYRIHSYKKPSGPVKQHCDVLKKVFPHIDYPLTADGAVIVEDMENEGKRYTLNLAAVKRGWKIMESDYVRHYADAISENHDATTGDVFLQCCLFGEVIYS